MTLSQFLRRLASPMPPSDLGLDAWARAFLKNKTRSKYYAHPRNYFWPFLE